MSDRVRFLLFDVETVGDPELIARVKYPKEPIEPLEALARYRAELIEKRGNDVLPFTFVVPIAVAVAKVDDDYRLVDIKSLDAPDYRPHRIARDFWRGWEHYNRPAFVTFNGRGYDLPVMELATYRYGLTVPAWFDPYGRSYEQPRNRYNIDSHIDLMDFFGNFGATRMEGGLNLLANLIGKPGKTEIDGSQVQDKYLAGEAELINRYCQCDVLDTYFVFLRSRVIIGDLKLDREQELVADTKRWLDQRADQNAAFAHYLENWGDWTPPPD